MRMNHPTDSHMRSVALTRANDDRRQFFQPFCLGIVRNPVFASITTVCSPTTACAAIAIQPSRTYRCPVPQALQ